MPGQAWEQAWRPAAEKSVFVRVQGVALVALLQACPRAGLRRDGSNDAEFGPLGRTRRPIWRTLLLLGFARVLINVLMVQRGMVALSDDDYARVTIAQRFAAHPAFDPSGTSWLPFPFWVNGTLLKLLDPSLETARVLSTVLAVAAAWLLYAAGRLWGFSDRVAFGVALLANLVPAAALLGCMTVPELPTAALGVFALLAVSSPPRAAPRVWNWQPLGEGPLLLTAGLAAIAASLSRYEAWPLAAVVAVLGAKRAWQNLSDLDPASTLPAATTSDAIPHVVRAWLFVAMAALLPIAGALGWILHNRRAHGDALAFLHRVSSYRAALGAPAGASTASYVTALIGGCPAVALAMALILFLFRRNNRVGLAALKQQLAALGTGAAAVVAFLIAGDALGGAPTHHPERALLVVWILAVFGCARMLVEFRPPKAWWLPVALLLFLDFRQQLTEVRHLRQDEELAGLQLRALVPAGAHVLVATPDYGYFAVAAAFARPDDVLIDRTHDPRSPNESGVIGDPWSSPTRMAAAGINWVVAPSRTMFPSALRSRSRVGELSIFERVRP
jgi:hypothetical protein